MFWLCERPSQIHIFGPLVYFTFTRMIGTLLWRTEILRTRRGAAQTSTEPPSVTIGAAQHCSPSSNPSSNTHLPTLLSFQRRLGSTKLATDPTQRLRARPGQSGDTHAKAVPSSPWQSTRPFVFDVHRSWKEHESSRGSFTHLLLRRASYISRHIWQG